MSKPDPFTVKRIEKAIAEHRRATGQLPTLQDFERLGLPRETVKAAERAGLIEEFYVTLTNGTIVKGYKIKD